MARSKSGKRDTNAIANDPLLGLTALPSSPSPILYDMRTLAYELQTLSEVEDRRTYHPADDLRPLYTPQGRRAHSRLVDAGARLRRFPAQTKAIRVFSHPNPLRTAIVCAKRKARKEVLHALGLTRHYNKVQKALHKRRGLGGGFHLQFKRKRSDIKC